MILYCKRGMASLPSGLKALYMSFCKISDEGLACLPKGLMHLVLHFCYQITLQVQSPSKRLKQARGEAQMHCTHILWFTFLLLDPGLGEAPA